MFVILNIIITLVVVLILFPVLYILHTVIIKLQIRLMRTFGINITTNDTFIGKLCIPKELYNIMSDTDLAICINNFLSELNAPIGVTVYYKDIQSHACTNQFIRVNTDDKNIWIVYGISESKYHIAEITNFKEH